MDKDLSSESNETPLIKRLFNLIGLFRTPDTAEDLELEIQELLEDGAEQGLISAQEGLMINSIFEFRDTLAKEIMTPKIEMICAPDTSTSQEIIILITQKGFTRIPIYHNTPDQITGILHAKDLLRHCEISNRPTLVRELSKQAFFILENHKIGQLLRDFKTRKVHMAIITDEFGSVRGLVTLEDVLEEIVGEISDESDKDEIRWKVIDNNTVLTDAKVDLEEVESFFDLSLPEGPYESIGGLVIHKLGHLPKAGESVKVQDITVQVMSATNRRIASLKIQRDNP